MCIPESNVCRCGGLDEVLSVIINSSGQMGSVFSYVNDGEGKSLD